MTKGSRLSGLLGAGELAWRAAGGRLVVGAACTVVLGVVPVVVAWCTKVVIDSLVSAKPGSVVAPAIALVGVSLAGAVLPRVGQYLRAEADRAVGLLAQDRLFIATERCAGLSRFEDPAFLDRLRLAQQAGGTAPNHAVFGLIDLASGAVTVCGFVGSLIVLSPELTLLIVLASVPVLLAELRVSRGRAAMIWTISPTDRREVAYALLLSSVQAAKEIRLFAMGRFLRGRMLTERRAANLARRRVDRRELAVEGGSALLAAIVSGAGLLWGILSARSGGISVGDVTLVIAAVAGVQFAIARMTSTIAQVHQQLLIFDHYLAVTRAASDLPSPVRPRALPPLRHGIELHDVWFRYSDDHPWALRGVTLFIPHGQATALVGRNGSGKTTLVKLLCRFYDPTRGVIRWDGVDLREVPVEDLRQRISAVFQDFMSYDLTARENVGLGDTGVLEPGAAAADRARVEGAARLAGVHDTLAGLPRGYDTLLTRIFQSMSDVEDPSTGVVLSGGQWQRVALARALLRDRRDLMVLDEPSAGLDAVAEHEVHTLLRAHRAGRTSLLISHRLGATRDADQIVVLSGGRVVETGGHDELVVHGGEYASLFHLQASGYQPSP